MASALWHQENPNGIDTPSGAELRSAAGGIEYDRDAIIAQIEANQAAANAPSVRHEKSAVNQMMSAHVKAGLQGNEDPNVVREVNKVIANPHHEANMQRLSELTQMASSGKKLDVNQAQERSKLVAENFRVKNELTRIMRTDELADTNYDTTSSFLLHNQTSLRKEQQ